MSRVDQILDGESGGFTPQATGEEAASQEARWNAARGAPAEAPVELEAEPGPEAPKPVIAQADIDALTRAGWSREDIEGLSPDAAARHALREGQRQKPERAEEPSGSDDLEAMLAEEFSAKTAKKLAPILKGITERQAALERGVRDSVVEGARTNLLGMYPELKRPEAMQAVLSIAGPRASAETIERAARSIFGVRQSPAERAEARAQVDGQMTGGRRGPMPAPNMEKAQRAAWAERNRTGNVEAAISVRKRLGG